MVILPLHVYHSGIALVRLPEKSSIWMKMDGKVLLDDSKLHFTVAMTQSNSTIVTLVMETCDLASTKGANVAGLVCEL